MTIPTIVAASAAAVLSTSKLTVDQKEELDDARYYVHPHVASVGSDDPALISYIKHIYSDSGKLPMEVQIPTSPAFKKLRSEDDVAAATREAAQDLADSMHSVSANPGIVFGFLLRLKGNRLANGLIKADLEDEDRFYMKMSEGNEWSIETVDELLPPPAQKYAKFAIAPRPRGPGAAGIRDVQAGSDAAAGYFLRSLGVVVPRTRGTQRAVAEQARQAGYSDRDIRKEMEKVAEDTAIDDLIEESFPDIDTQARERLRGTPERPLDTVRADDPFVTKYSTSEPTFELRVGPSVKVKIEGSTITVELPDGHTRIDHSYE